MFPSIIAVHCGAGVHCSDYRSEYNKLCKQACLRGLESLKNGGSALEAVRDSIITLENHPRTNCGYGSNLTIDGEVENDASIMNGETLLYGGCGAVKRLKNPIQLAYDLCTKQTQENVLGLIPPSLLVGSGALNYAKSIGLKTVSNKTMISVSSAKRHKKYLEVYQEATRDKEQNLLLDTVGAVCMDANGNFAAASSSGGILLKKSGRVGQGALYASGTWADSSCKDNEPSIAVCTSGCGEHLVRTQLAKEIANDLTEVECPTTGLYKCLTDKFINSKFLKNVDNKLCGVLVLSKKNDEVSFMWGHSTETMSVGYMRSDDKRPSAFISELPVRSKVGQIVNIGGYHYSV
ncbi:threonine aspartase 1 [Coccinella septempunctata]|uniref:threonine aspartase 1 n=1 Tax=Coccinella septempunctata TaxID=41139 RepID=UPI001D09257F|nr:threonine aspartase 1 [Coccinella septempunctata]